jgi:hypothetical protein
MDVRNSKALMAKCFQMTMSGDETHLSRQNWMFNAGPALSLYRESSVGAFDRSTGAELFRLFITHQAWLVPLDHLDQPGLDEVDFRRHPGGDRAQPVPRPCAALAL